MVIKSEKLKDNEMRKNFHVLIKPASSLCNMNCKYCFYDDVSNKRKIKSYGIMSQDTSHKIIDRALQACPEGEITFSFQGGEPTLAKLDFFLDFTEYAQQAKTEKIKYMYSIQTNGLLIDETWCRLFKEHDFLAGVSLDGLKEAHDNLRKDNFQKDTFNRVMNGINLLKKYEVTFNILTVVNKYNVRHPQKLWNIYEKNGFDYIQLIPCLSSLDNTNCNQPYALEPKAYADFLKTFFDIWLQKYLQGKYVSIRVFDNLVKMCAGYPPEQCGMTGFCQAQFVIEADGSVYPCDFYVLDDFNGGNINTQDFDSILNSDNFNKFLKDNSSYNLICSNCEVKDYCNGGCRRYRYFYFQTNDYCPQKDFLTHALPALKKIAVSLR
jgi:uncharacterized protein